MKGDNGVMYVVVSEWCVLVSGDGVAISRLTKRRREDLDATRGVVAQRRARRL